MWKRRIVIGCIVVAALSIAIEFAPTILIIAHSVGIGVAKNELYDIKVEMNKRWVPLISPGSILESLFKRGDKPQLLFLRAEGTLSQITQVQRYVVFLKLSQAPEEAMFQKSEETLYSWGAVRLLKPTPDATQYQNAYLPAYNLLITASDMSDIADIQKITKQWGQSDLTHERWTP